MELMKSVGAHPHIVSLVGCCSSRRPFIVAEYCSRGDLLSFLRFVNDKNKIEPKRVPWGTPNVVVSMQHQLIESVDMHYQS